MKPRRKKIFKVIIITVAVIVVAVFVAGWYLSNNLERIVQTKLVEQVEKHSGGLYHLNLKKLTIKKRQGLLQIEGAELFIDSIVFDSLQKINKAPKTTIRLSTRLIELNISNLKTLSKNGYLTIERLTVVSPTVLLTTNNAIHNAPDETKPNTDEGALYKIVAPFFSTIGIDKIEVSNGSIAYTVERTTDTLNYTVDEVNLTVDGVLIDSTFTVQQNVMPRCKNLVCQAKRIHTVLPNKVYDFSVKEVNFQLRDSVLKLDSVCLTPKYSKYEFAKQSPNHKDWIELNIENITLVGIHIHQLLANKQLIIDSVHVEHAGIASFKNRKISGIRAKKPLFHKLVHKIPIPFLIPTLTVSNSEAVYEELAVNGETPGKVNFTQMNARLLGLTNILHDKNQHFTLNAKARLFGSGALSATFTFPVDSLDDRFTIAGMLQQMDLTLVNAMATPLGNIKIVSGQVQQADFNIAGTNIQSTLSMQFLYNNLSIELYKIKDHEAKKRGFLSGLVNSLVIDKANPAGKGAIRKVTTHTTRDLYRSNFNYLWRTMRDGIKETVGIPG